MMYGHGYLFYEEIRRQDYAAAAAYLIRAEQMAEESGNPAFRGATGFYRGQLHLFLKETDKAIAGYKGAVKNCRIAGDSLCIGRSLEQLSAVYLFKREADSIEMYYQQAVPILQEHGDENDLATAKGNYARYLNMRFRTKEAIPLLKEIIELRKNTNNHRSLAVSMNNLADAYRRSGQYEKALAQYEICLEHSRKHGIVDVRVAIFSGLEMYHLKTGNFQEAYRFRDSFMVVRDSLTGKETQQKIADIDKKFQLAKKDLEIETAEKELVVSQAKSAKIFWTALTLGILLIVAVGAWRIQTVNARRNMEKGRKNLHRLTRQLLEKNTAILELEQKLDMVEDTVDPAADQDDLHLMQDIDLEHYNILDSTILTEEDWTDFKVYFEDTHPGLLKKLRSVHSDMTPAEQRLFLLLRLKLTTKEIATILGISAGGVKKTRNRLRKRLSLVAEHSLEEHVSKFTA